MTIAMLFVGSLSANALEQDDQGIYQINTVDDLVAFADLVNSGEDAAYAVLNADLDMDGVEYYPIGTEDVPYTGTFDGQGHVLKSLTINGLKYVGVFGAVGGGACIKNLIVDENSSITAERLAAGIVGGTIGGALLL